MKTSFLWSWNDRAPWPDENMTRARAARLARYFAPSIVYGFFCAPSRTARARCVSRY